MQIAANFKTALSDCLQSEELYRVAQTISSFFIPLNYSYYSKFLVLKATEKGFILPRKNSSGQNCKALSYKFFLINIPDLLQVGS